MQITASQQKFADAHKARLKKFWPQRRADTAPVQPKPLTPVTAEWFAAAWGMLDGPTCARTIRDVQDMVCKHFEVPLLYMETTRRAHKFYLPRAAAVFLSHRYTTKSVTEIGRRFGNRDHTTILSCVAAVEKMIALKHPISKDIETLSAKLGGFQ